MAEFSGQFLGTFQQAEVSRSTIYWDNAKSSRASTEQLSFQLFYHLGLVQLVLETSPGALLHLYIVLMLSIS